MTKYFIVFSGNGAAEPLATTSRQVKEVADEVGYPDPYHFSRLFKKHFGYPPRVFCENLPAAMRRE